MTNDIPRTAARLDNKIATPEAEAVQKLAASVDGNAAPAPRSPSRRKISEDLESTPSPHKAGVQRNISMPKPMKL